MNLKAIYEAHEEDNKQLSIVVVLLGAVITLLNLTLSTLAKEATIGNALTALIIAAFSIFGVATIGILISKRNIETIQRRKAIELLLTDRDARAKAKTNNN